MATLLGLASGRARVTWVVAPLPTLILLALACSARGLPRQHKPPAAMPKSELRVECGKVLTDGPSPVRLRSGCVRLLVGHAPRSSLGIAFRYLGPSPDAVPLASGELRRQIGIKLRAKDTCNVVYVMWHLGPVRGLHVSVKSNPGKREHAQCRDNGYVQVAADSRREPPAVGVGGRHTLSAQINGRVLRAYADGALAWEGRLPAAAFAFDGPAGLRSDNGNFDVVIDGLEVYRK